MRFGKRHADDRLRSIEITPMIDVVFLLIIFFMTTARFAKDTRAELDLPQERGEQQETAEEAGLVVNVTAEGTIIVAQQEVSLDDLEQIVTAEVARMQGRKAEAAKLMIRADRNAPSDRLNLVIARLQRLGVGAARLATEVP
jgi:biopolymer transport protein ExbD